MVWVAFRHEDGSWQVQRQEPPHWYRPEWIPRGGRIAKVLASHRNGKHARRRPKTCPSCKEA